MIEMRSSNSASPNQFVRQAPRPGGQSNSDWLRATVREDDLQGAIVLLGGTSRTSVRLRFAQSQARRDLLPSFWSHAALVLSGDSKSRGWRIAEVSLEPHRGFGDVPYNNAVQTGSFSQYDDPEDWPNVACLIIRASNTDADAKRGDLAASLEAVRRQRQLADLTSSVIDWLGFVWGAEGATNPLLRNRGFPSAVLVEAVYAVIGLDLTPGLATTATCPEAIWQSAKWWHNFYSTPASRASGPFTGSFCIGQEAAAVRTSWAPAPARRRARRSGRR